jgi:excisionase family DNA binding protein
MPRTKSKPIRTKPIRTKPSVPPVSECEVLTLTEAAAYLRVTESAVRQMLNRQAIPGQKVGSEWRFLKIALQDWLRSPPSHGEQGFWETQAGAFRDDPMLEEIAREAYRKRVC